MSMERFGLTGPEQGTDPAELPIQDVPEHSSPAPEVPRGFPFPETALDTWREVDPDVTPEMEAALREDWDRIGENPEGLSRNEVAREQMSMLVGRTMAKLRQYPRE